MNVYHLLGVLRVDIPSPVRWRPISEDQDAKGHEVDVADESENGSPETRTFCIERETGGPPRPLSHSGRHGPWVSDIVLPPSDPNRF